MTQFIYERPFQIEKDTTCYRLLTKKYVKIIGAGRRKILQVDPQGLELLAREAVSDLSFFLRTSHTEKLRGLQLDVEPYLLPAYKDNKAKVLFNFVNFIDETVARLDKSDLSLSVVIPEFYDGENDMTPKFTYNGQKNYAISHLLRVLDKREGSKIIVMSYRNKSEGKDGAIEISKGEISVAEKFKTKIVLAEETGDVEPPYITFHNTSKSYYLKQVSLLEKAFSKNKSYNGIAIHYVNSFLDLK